MTSNYKPNAIRCQRILVIKSRNIGDVLLVTPLISSLKQGCPGSQIYVLVKAETSGVLAGNADISLVLTYPERKEGESYIKYLFGCVSWWLNIRGLKFDCCINTTEGERGAITGLLVGAKHRIGGCNHKKSGLWHKFFYTEECVSASADLHAVVQNLRFLPKEIAWNSNVSIFSSEKDEQRIDSLLKGDEWVGKGFVQVHPTSRWMFKSWTNEGMAHVIDYLQNEKGFRVVLTCGPDQKERDVLESILAMCKSKPIDLGAILNLTELAALASRCRMYIGVDTAPMHIAAARGVPVIALFGPTGCYNWGPWPNGASENLSPYRNRSGVQNAYPHKVLQLDWDCIPCGRAGCDNSKVSRCMLEISPEAVINEIDCFTSNMDES